VVVRDGDTVYEVTRHRKHATWKNALRIMQWNPAAGYPLTPGKDITKATPKEQAQQIEEIMGCSYEVFKAAIYAGQEDMPDLPKMTDKQLKVLIEEASGTDRLERAYVLALKKENAVAGQLTAARGLLDQTKARLEDAHRTLLVQRNSHA